MRAFEELVKRLREEAGVVVDEAALQGVMPEDVKLGASAPPAVREASASGAPAAPTPAGR